MISTDGPPFCNHCYRQLANKGCKLYNTTAIYMENGRAVKVFRGGHPKGLDRISRTLEATGADSSPESAANGVGEGQR
jgi:hypothetical protein